jgi:ABC-type polysaccharide/polyol phosphate export permease
MAGGRFYQNVAAQTIAMAPDYRGAVGDFVEAVRHIDIWGRMGWGDIRRRYRRTVIGPFWASFSLAIFVVTMGMVWATIFNINPKEYLPYLTSGMLVWLLLSAFITEGCQVFVAAESLIKQLRINYTILLFAMVWRNLIAFGHNLLVYLPVALYCGVHLGATTLMIIPGLAFLCLNGMWMALVLGMLCARFRDLQQVVASFLQIAIFVTPIFWSPAQLGRSRIALVDANLLYHYVEIVRDPLLGQPPSARSWLMVVLATLAGWALAIFLFSRFRRRISYWL